MMHGFQFFVKRLTAWFIGLLGENASDFDGTVLRLDYLYGIVADFQAGARFRNVLKVFED